MTQKELDDIISNDIYFQKRKNPTESELRLFLREVGYHCPLCGTELQSRKQKKPSLKRFQIAHIYPNRPTIDQYETLDGLERMGKSTEDFENKIALCLNCHPEQDFRTTKEDYLRLLEIKKMLLSHEGRHDALHDLSLEAEIAQVVEKICSIDFNQEPIPVAKKFRKNEFLFLAKIEGFVKFYYTYINQCFVERDGKEGFLFDNLSSEMKIAFGKLKVQSTSEQMDKSQIFASLVDWLKHQMVKNQIFSPSTDACEAVVAFFIQHCEVFDEISE